MAATGVVADAGVDEVVRCLDHPAFTGLSPGMLTAWGRAPG
jgi:hypothetical protein